MNRDTLTDPIRSVIRILFSTKEGRRIGSIIIAAISAMDIPIAMLDITRDVRVKAVWREVFFLYAFKSFSAIFLEFVTLFLSKSEYLGRFLSSF